MSAQLNAIKTLTSTLTKSELVALCEYLNKQVEPKKTTKPKKINPYANVGGLF